jgi:hypothetical protein
MAPCAWQHTSELTASESQYPFTELQGVTTKMTVILVPKLR